MITYLKRVIAPKEVRIALNVLDEIGFEVGYSEGFTLAKSFVEKALKDFSVVRSQVKEGAPRTSVLLFG